MPKCMHLHNMHIWEFSVQIHLAGCHFRWEKMSGEIVESINAKFALLATDQCMYNAQTNASA